MPLPHVRNPPPDIADRFAGEKRGALLLTKCANPECATPFDYRQGQFFRFPKNTCDGEQPANLHSVQHFWLCGDCSEIYTLSYWSDRGVVLTQVFARPAGSESRRLIAAV
jgi:hypothetical protein